MIEGLPSFISVSGCSSSYQNESSMLLIKPILEDSPAERTTVSGPPGRLPLNSFSTPKSPKICELLAKHNARCAKERDWEIPERTQETNSLCYHNSTVK